MGPPSPCPSNRGPQLGPEQRQRTQKARMECGSCGRRAHSPEDGWNVPEQDSGVILGVTEVLVRERTQGVWEPSHLVHV